MRRDYLVCSVILAYCLFAVYFLYTAFVPITASSYIKTPEVLASSDVKFAALPDAPDPNQVFELANKTRADQGSNPLIADEKLGKVAAARASDMVQRQYYAHKSPDGKYYYDLFPEHGINSEYNCENLDLVFVPRIEMFIDEWMTSTKGHRDCLINPKLTAAGYAATKLMLIDYFGKETAAYLVVAIHTTDLK